MLYPLEREITALACRTDKLKIFISGTIEYENVEHISDLLGLISSSEDTNRPRENRVLNSISGRHGNIQEIHRTNWLFHGQLRHGPNGERSRHISLELDVNPTRFAEHCRRSAGIFAAYFGGAFELNSIEALRQLPTDVLLRKRRDVILAMGAETLDGRDNMIEHSRWLSVISRQWGEFVGLYVSAICRLIAADFNRSACELDPFTPCVMRFQSPEGTAPIIGLVEQHVEFVVEDAHHAFDIFLRAFEEAGQSLELTERSQIDRQSGREGSARWAKTHLRSGVALKIYAKSFTRFRIEVEYKSKGGSRGVTVRDMLHAEFQGRRRASLIDWIRDLQDDAVRRISVVTNYLSREQVPTNATAADLLRDLLLALRGGRLKAPEVQAFLSELFSEGGVGGAPGSPVRRVAEAMVKRGLLEPVSTAERGTYRRFRPIHALRTAIDAVRSLEVHSPP